jgi:hypothetical protein
MHLLDAEARATQFQKICHIATILEHILHYRRSNDMSK